MLTTLCAQALQQLQGSGFRNLPVVSSSGVPVGVVDVLSLLKRLLLDPAVRVDAERSHESDEPSCEHGYKLALPWGDTRLGLSASANSLEALRSAVHSALAEVRSS